MALIFDKAKYHYEGDFPSYLPVEQAYVHTGIFVGWLADNNLLGREVMTNFADELASFKARQISGPALYRLLGGVLDDEMLNPIGRDFAAEYFDFDRGRYLKDYENILVAGLPTLYSVQDTWENYERIVPTLDRRFADWTQSRQKR